MDRKLYLFFFSDANGNAVEKGIAEKGREATRKSLLHNASMMLSFYDDELYKHDAFVVLPDEYAAALPETSDSSEFIFENAKWYLFEKEPDREALQYDENMTIFRDVMGMAMMPVWAMRMQSPARTIKPSEEPPAQATKVSAQEDFPTRTNALRGNSTPQKDGSGALHWENVYVFISSTFNDMHAERDYLVKRVFPELSAWCAERRLRLIDIDLRWGITEADSCLNQRTVEICLKSIDRCRPFFLCFLGQRRGWVPRVDEISEETFRLFPGLTDKTGHSVTEIEILHALIDPMGNDSILTRAEYAFFYRRDGGYINDIKTPALRAIYTNEASAHPAEDTRALAEYRDRIIPETGRPCHDYTARWDPNVETPELRFSLQYDSTVIQGQLTDFQCGEIPLSEQVLADMKQAITARYGKRTPVAETPLMRELEAQAQFLQNAAETFIAREGDLAELTAYLADDEGCPLVLTAPSGTGKTSLLAHFLLHSPARFYYRFIGRSEHSESAEEVAASLLEEWRAEGRLHSKIPEDPGALLRDFGGLMAEAAAEAPLYLALDALDQLRGGTASAAFLPFALPHNVKLLLTVKRDAPEAEQYLQLAEGNAHVVRISPFTSEDDRRALVEVYLGQYLKHLDEARLKLLIDAEGAENPLFLNVVLRELRVFGSHEELTKLIAENFGKTPQSAFDALLERLETDAPYCSLPMKALTKNVFGWLCHARDGLTKVELTELLVQCGATDSISDARDAVNTLTHQLRPYLAQRDERLDFFYDSFRAACLCRYERVRSAEAWHSDLAAYLLNRPTHDPHRLRELAYQLLASGKTEAYLDCVFDFTYLEARLTLFGPRAVITDFLLYVDTSTAQMASFFRMCAPVLTAMPDQLISRLYGHLGSEKDTRVKQLLAEAALLNTRPWLKPLYPCFERPVGDVRNYSINDKVEHGLALLAGDALAAVNLGNSLCLLDPASGEERLRISLKEWNVRRISASADGARLAAYLDIRGNTDRSSTKILRIWDGATLSKLCDISLGDWWPETRWFGVTYTNAPAITFTGDHRALLIKDARGALRLYDASDGSMLSEVTCRWDPNQLAVSETGLIATGNLHPQRNDSKWHRQNFQRIQNPLSLFHYDAKKGTLSALPTQIGDLRDNIRSVALSADGHLVAASVQTGVRVWSTNTGERLAELQQPGVCALHFLPGGEQLLAVSESGVATLYDAVKFRQTACWTGLGTVYAAAVSVDGRHCLLDVGESSLKFFSLAEDAAASAAAERAIASIGYHAQAGIVYASSYRNTIEYGNTPVATPIIMDAIYAFDAASGKRVKTLHLGNCTYADFVYVQPDGGGVVSKDYVENCAVVVKYWPLQETDDPLVCDSFNIRDQMERFGERIPNFYQFSSDYRYIIDSSRMREGLATVYRATTGRVMCQTSIYASGLGKLFRKKKEKCEDCLWQFEVAQDRVFLLRHQSADYNQLEVYSLADGKRMLRVSLDDATLTEFLRTHFTNDSLTLTADGSKLLFLVGDRAVCIDLADRRVTFNLDRRTNKPGKDISEDGCYAACDAAGRLLAITRAIYDGAKNTTYLIQVWNMQSNECLAAFAPDGAISNILWDNKEGVFLFGTQQGRLCKLRLEMGNEKGRHTS